MPESDAGMSALVEYHGPGSLGPLSCLVVAPSSSGGGLPGVLFLHGRGESGGDPEVVARTGLPARVLAEGGWPGVIVAPCKPEADRLWEAYAPEALACLDAASARFGVDRGRVSLTGLSQGGAGVWTLARWPGASGRFGALAPVCGFVSDGPWNRGRRLGRREVLGVSEREADLDGLARAIAGKPVWAFHGERDGVVPPEQTTGVARGLARRGVDIRVTLYAEAGHDSWTRAYAEPGTRAFLLGAGG